MGGCIHTPADVSNVDWPPPYLIHRLDCYRAVTEVHFELPVRPRLSDDALEMIWETTSDALIYIARQTSDVLISYGKYWLYPCKLHGPSWRRIYEIKMCLVFDARRTYFRLQGSADDSEDEGAHHPHLNINLTCRDINIASLLQKLREVEAIPSVLIPLISDYWGLSIEGGETMGWVSYTFRFLILTLCPRVHRTCCLIAK